MPALEEDILDFQSPDAHASVAVIRTVNSGRFYSQSYNVIMIVQALVRITGVSVW